MKKEHGYTKCDSEDLDPFNKCKPVNCEEKYLGKRNFFNESHCIPVARCDAGNDVFYDFNTNECRKLGKVFSDEDMRQIKSGNFTNWIEESREEIVQKSFEVKWIYFIEAFLLKLYLSIFYSIC